MDFLHLKFLICLIAITCILFWYMTFNIDLVIIRFLFSLIFKVISRSNKGRMVVLIGISLINVLLVNICGYLLL